MAELLARQCEEEIDHTRMVEAHALGAKAADSISEKHLSLITRFKAPPPALLTLLDATFLLLKLPLAPPEDAALSPAEASWAAAVPICREDDGAALLRAIRALDFGRVDPETVEQLEPLLRCLTYAEVRKSIGILANLWVWVNCAAVVAGSAAALLPGEASGSAGSPNKSEPSSRRSTPLSRRGAAFGSSTSLASLGDSRDASPKPMLPRRPSYQANLSAGLSPSASSPQQRHGSRPSRRRETAAGTRRRRTASTRPRHRRRRRRRC